MVDKLTLKDKMFLCISFLYILYTIFPLFSHLIPLPVYSVVLVVVVAIGLLYPRLFLSKTFLWYVLYVVVLLLYVLLGKQIHINGLAYSLSPFNRLMIEAAWILPSIVIFNVLLLRNSKALYRYIGYGSIIILAISFIYILPSLFAHSHFLREEFDSESVPLGLPEYDLMHSYALMIFPLCLLFKRKDGFRKFLVLLSVILFFYVVIKTEVTTSFFISIISILLVLFYRPNRKSQSVLSFSVLLIIVMVLYYSGAMISIVEFLLPYFDGSTIAFKLNDIHDSLLEGKLTGDTLTGRTDYHGMSINAFLSNPVIGSMPVGGHSKILDTLGAMGLLAFIPYIMIIISTLKYYTKRVSQSVDMRVYLFVSFLLASVFLYTKGIFGAPGYLFMFVIVPATIMTLQDHDN